MDRLPLDAAAKNQKRKLSQTMHKNSLTFLTKLDLNNENKNVTGTKIKRLQNLETGPRCIRAKKVECSKHHYFMS